MWNSGSQETTKHKELTERPLHSVKG